MSHTFLSLDMNLIPQSTKDNVPTFYSGLFSNDNTRLLIDGKSESGEMVHPRQTLLSWVQWSDDPDKVIQDLIDNSIEYTKADYMELKQNPISIWYVEHEAIL